RRFDWVVLICLIAVMVFWLPRLRVYYRSTPTRIVAVSIDEGERAESYETPESLDQVFRSPTKAYHAVLEFVQTPEGRRFADPERKTYWTINYSYNSLDYELAKVLVTPIEQAE
ncbi:MAG: hypothetical protein AAF085_15385, partial [Planctomycetota bacterium]